MDRFTKALLAFALAITFLYVLIVRVRPPNSAFYTQCGDLRKLVTRVAAGAAFAVVPGSARGTSNEAFFIDSDSSADFHVTGTPEAVGAFVLALKKELEATATATQTKLTTVSSSQMEGVGLSALDLSFTTGHTRGKAALSLTPAGPGKEPNTTRYLLKVRMDERGW